MLLTIAACACVVCMHAQSHKLVPEDIETKYVFPETDWDIEVKIHRTVYYDKDDQKTPHGAFTAKGVGKADQYRGHYNSRGKFIPNYRVTGSLSYSASGNYKEGKLDGVIKIHAVQTFTSPHAYSYDHTLTAQYDNGVPCGTWTASYNINDGDGKRAATYVATMDKNGHVSSVRNSAGTCTFNYTGKEEEWTFNETTKTYEVYTVTGKWEGVNYVNDYNMDVFKRLNGDETKPDEEAMAILKGLSSGAMSRSDAIDKGYCVQHLNAWNSDFVAEWQDVVRGVDLYEFDLSKGNKNNYHSTMCHRWQLERTKLLSYDEVLKKIGDREISDKDLQTINENYIVVHEGWNDNRTYYFNHEVKAQLIALLEEKLRVEAYADSLANKLKALNERLKKDYSEVKVFKDELEVVEKQCCAEELLKSKDTTRLQHALKIAETIAGTMDIILDGCVAKNEVLKALKKSDSDLSNVYDNMTKFRVVDCPQDLEGVSAYHAEMEVWRANLDQLKISVNECLAVRQQSQQYDAVIKASKCPNLLSVYNSATEPKLTEDMDTNISKAKEWVSSQKDFMLVDSLYSEQLKKDEAIILKCGKTFSDIKKTYTKAKSEIDVEPKANLPMTITNLRKLNAIQDGCLAFLQEKEKVLATDATLTEQGKPYKNIAKVYQKFFKDADLTWTPSATTATLLMVQQVQNVIGEAYASPKAAELDKMVKEDKNKTIENVLVIIQKNK